jgi:hypothetical protein
MFLDHFDALISKIILKNKKNIILIHFWVKSTLKNNRNHTHQTMINLLGVFYDRQSGQVKYTML